MCRREVCIPLLIISAVLLIFHIASIISAARYAKILRYEKEAKLRQLLKATTFSPSSLSIKEEYSDEESEAYKSAESTSPSNTRSPSRKSYENNYPPDENISAKNAPTVDEVVQSTTGYSTHSTKSAGSISSRRSWVMKLSSESNGNGSLDFDAWNVKAFPNPQRCLNLLFDRSFQPIFFGPPPLKKLWGSIAKVISWTKSTSFFLRIESKLFFCDVEFNKITVAIFTIRKKGRTFLPYLQIDRYYAVESIILV